jgi:hypothetical protein
MFNGCDVRFYYEGGETTFAIDDSKSCWLYCFDVEGIPGVFNSPNVFGRC